MGSPRSRWQQKSGGTMKIDTVGSGLERDFEVLVKFPGYILDRLDHGDCTVQTLVDAVPAGTEMARIYFVADAIDRLRRYGLVRTERHDDDLVIKKA